MTVSSREISGEGVVLGQMREIVEEAQVAGAVSGVELFQEEAVIGSGGTDKPSLSELMFELDLGDNLVGRTAFCVEPADRVGAVPSVGGTKKIKWQRLEHLAPSHVLVNIDETPKALAERLAAAGMRTIAHDPENHYPVIDDMAALLPQADQILFASEPFSFGDELRRQFRADFAVRDSPRLRLVDGQMLSWYGSRAIRGLAYPRRLATETEG